MDSVRERIVDFIGLQPVAEPPTVRVVNRESEDGYARRLVQYSVPDGDVVDAFIFEPADKRPMAAVLALHQHNSQWAIGKSEIAGLAGDPLQAFGPALARRGVSVLAPDAIGFESRLGTAGGGIGLAPPLTKPGGSAEGWLQYDNQMAHRLVQGDLLIRKMVTDCMVGISLLKGASIEGIPVGVIGHSLGGGLALFVGALDTRVSFTCSSGAVGSYRHKLARGTGLEMSFVIPGFARQFDVHDLVRCIAPRRVLVVSAEDDAASADADQVVNQAKAAFEVLNCVDHLEHLRVPGGHALDTGRFDAIVEWTSARCEFAG